MANESRGTDAHGWLEAIGLPHILRVLEFTLAPNKLAIAGLAIIANIFFGMLLDAVWTERNGVGADAVTQMIASTASNTDYEEPDGTEGIFEVWSGHEKRSLLALMSLSPAPDLSSLDPRLAAMTHGGGTGRPGSLADMALGVCWMARFHTFYFVLFAVGSLLIWSFAGGTICRLTALEFTQGEKPQLSEAVGYVKRTWLGGNVLAPCIPLAFALVAFVLLFIGGVALRIPLVGDLVAGAMFFLAILGGFFIAAVMVGLGVGGSFFFPAVATDGADAFDAFSRSLSYAFRRPWKTVVYALITTVYAAICWAVVRWFVAFGLGITRATVGVGTSPFGWWARGTEDNPVSKMELVWPVSGAGAMHAWPDFAALTWYECISAVLIGIWVTLAILFVWSFLATFYYSACTVIYTLLRRDVDGADLSDLYVDEGAGVEVESQPSDAGTAAPTISRVSAPAAGDSGAEPPSGKKAEPPKSESGHDEGKDGDNKGTGGDDEGNGGDADSSK